MRITILKNKKRINEVVEVHMQSFTGFFLTFLGRGFLKHLYTGFVEHSDSGLIVAIDGNDRIVGFLAYSDDLSAFYKYLIKKRLFPFFWYAGCAFLRNPKIMFRLLRALSYSEKAEREEQYIELSSIGVLSVAENKGIGSRMIAVLKKKFDCKKYEYIKLETDAVENESVNCFYQKNGFVLDHEYTTKEGRRMNEYRYYLKKNAEEFE